MVEILFPVKHNEELIRLERDDVSVVLPSDISTDDLIFELRHAFSKEIGVPLSKICLVIEGQSVLEGYQAPSEFSATFASDLAKSGFMTVRVLTEPVEDPEMGPDADVCDVQVLFPVHHNEELRRRGTDAVSVVLPSDISTEDLIFELRHAVSESIDVPLSKICLAIDGKSVSVSQDAPRGFNAALASDLAISGVMTTEVVQGRPMSDAQLDQLVEQFELARLDENRKKIDEERVLNKSREVSNRFSQSIRSCGEDVFYSYLESDGSVSPTSERREELRDALDSVSEMEGLTQDEMKLKLALLKRGASALSEELSRSLYDFELSAAGALATAMSSEAPTNIGPMGGATNTSLKILSVGNRGAASRKNISRRGRDVEDDDVPVIGSLEVSQTPVQTGKRLFVGSVDPPVQDDREPNLSPEAAGKMASKSSRYRGKLHLSIDEDKGLPLSRKLNGSSSTVLNIDLDRTVDTDVSGTGSADLADVKERADFYERIAATSKRERPPPSPSGYSASSPGRPISREGMMSPGFGSGPASPFGHMRGEASGDDESDNESFAISDETYG